VARALHPARPMRIFTLLMLLLTALLLLVAGADAAPLRTLDVATTGTI
jgi:hypothetical protein